MLVSRARLILEKKRLHTLQEPGMCSAIQIAHVASNLWFTVLPFELKVVAYALPT